MTRPLSLAPTADDSLKNCLTCPKELPEGTTATQCDDCTGTRSVFIWSGKERPRVIGYRFQGRDFCIECGVLRESEDIPPEAEPIVNSRENRKRICGYCTNNLRVFNI